MERTGTAVGDVLGYDPPPANKQPSRGVWVDAGVTVRAIFATFTPVDGDSNCRCDHDFCKHYPGISSPRIQRVAARPGLLLRLVGPGQLRPDDVPAWRGVQLVRRQRHPEA